MGANISLEDVPGIGEIRSETLQRAGYTSAEDVAEAPIGELREVPKVGYQIAQCIRETARNVCGYDDTHAANLSEELGVDRWEVAAAYAELAFTGITPDMAELTLRRLFDDAEVHSILRFDRYSPMYRHYLLEAGFDRIEDVAEASIEDLAQAKYVGQNRASSLRAAARELLATETECPSKPAAETVLPWHHVRVPASNTVEWSAVAQILAHRRYDPDVWDQDRESNEIIKFAKQGETRLAEKFVRELTSVYGAAISGSEIDPTYITVMPGHDGEIAEPLVQLSRDLTKRFELEYAELLSRDGSGRRQKFLPGTDRWRNQEESLVATHALSGESIVVLDDISTSGASFTTATYRLEQRGADTVICLALGLTTNQRQSVTTVDDPATTISEIADVQ